MAAAINWDAPELSRINHEPPAAEKPNQGDAKLSSEFYGKAGRC
jgi:hypothetical protein